MSLASQLLIIKRLVSILFINFFLKCLSIDNYCGFILAILLLVAKLSL